MNTSPKVASSYYSPDPPNPLSTDATHSVIPRFFPTTLPSTLIQSPLSAQSKSQPHTQRKPRSRLKVRDQEPPHRTHHASQSPASFRPAGGTTEGAVVRGGDAVPVEGEEGARGEVLVPRGEGGVSGRFRAEGRETYLEQNEETSE